MTACKFVWMTNFKLENWWFAYIHPIHEPVVQVYSQSMKWNSKTDIKAESCDIYKNWRQFYSSVNFAVSYDI